MLIASLSAGCGYVGEPLPPLLNIPERVTDLTDLQRGANLIVRFKVPQLTTEGMVLKELPKLEVRIGQAPDPFNADAWAPGAKVLREIPVEDGMVNLVVPAGQWIGKEVVVGAKVYGVNGRDAGWSNLASISLVPPLEPPAQLTATAIEDGVQLRWSGSGNDFRVFRRVDDEPAFANIAEIAKPEWVDSGTEYGRTYHYQVQAFSGKAESEFSTVAQVTPQDRFAPPPPAGLTATPGGASVELAWERNLASDLAGYRIYRSAGQAPFEKIGESQLSPSFSDRKIASGQAYRYAVSAVDHAGNESALSTPTSVTAP